MWSRAHVSFAAAGIILLPVLYLCSVFILWNSLHATLYASLFFAACYLSFFRAIALPMLTSPLRHLPPAPDDGFFFGHAPKIMAEGRIERFLDWMTRVENDGMLRVTGLFHRSHEVLVTRPEIAWEILTTKTHRFQKPGKIRKWLAMLAGRTGLFTIEGKAHTLQRKSLQRVFTNTAIRNLTPFLWRKCAELGDEIERRMRKLNKDEIMLDIQPLAAGATLDITALLLFGKDMNCLRDEEEPMQEVWGLLTNPKHSNGQLTIYFILQMVLPRKVADWVYPKFATQFKKGVKDLRTYCHDIVVGRRQELRQKSKIDILSLMLADEKAFANDDEVVDQLVTFLTAGHDTTTGAFLWAMWILSTEPEVQHKIRSEFCDKVGCDEDGDMDARKLDKLEYLGAVSNEVLRLYPTVPITPRVAVKDTIVGSVMIPKGTLVYISSWALQRMSDVWGSDASQFRPERWLFGENPVEGGASAPHAFVAFVSGPRSCIGQYLARTELRSMILAVLNKFEVSRVDTGEAMGMTGIISNQPDRDMKLRFRKLPQL